MEHADQRFGDDLVESGLDVREDRIGGEDGATGKGKGQRACLIGDLEDLSGKKCCLIVA